MFQQREEQLRNSEKRLIEEQNKLSEAWNSLFKYEEALSVREKLVRKQEQVHPKLSSWIFSFYTQRMPSLISMQVLSIISLILVSFTPRNRIYFYRSWTVIELVSDPVDRV